ncbi:MAG TPA: ribulose-phosphate 3-epimerase [Cyanobacteria bacterium UBA8530]|nr:ribulose-phosphate 3-epimerase [Cyanobacteria bacterium UBA8530]
MIVAPSMLSADFAELSLELERVEKAEADWIHLDVMDGHFVSNLTFGPPVIKAMRKHSALPFDVHLMIESPDSSLKAYREAGADLITVHAEVCPHLHRTLGEIRKLGAKSGVALNPSTPLTGLEYVLDQLDLVLFMTVNPGFGGQKFISSVLGKIEEFRRIRGNRPILISVDGGIDRESAALVKAAGAEVLVAGSSVFGKEDLKEAISALKA